MTQSDHAGFGIMLRLLSGFLGAAMVVSVKAVSDDVPLGEIVFFRSAIAILPLVLFLWLRAEFPGGLRTKRPWGHVMRSGFGAIAMFTSFASIARLPIAEATLVSYLAPVLTAVAAVVLFGERMTPFRTGGLALGLAGVAVLVWPELGGGEIDQRRMVGLGLGVITAVLTALALAMTRDLVRTDSPGSVAFWFAITSAAAGLLTLPAGWVMPSGSVLGLLVLAGLFGGCAHIAMTLAFRYTEASRLAPFEYVALIWPVLADLLIFHLPLAPAFLLALPLVLSGAALAAMEGRRSVRAAG